MTQLCWKSGTSWRRVAAARIAMSVNSDGSWQQIARVAAHTGWEDAECNQFGRSRWQAAFVYYAAAKGHCRTSQDIADGVAIAVALLAARQAYLLLHFADSS